MEEEKTTNEEIMAFLQETVATKEDLNKQKQEILDGVDRKIGDLKGDLVVMMRGEDKKVSELITV